MVLGRSSGTTRPASSARRMPGAPSGSTPTTRMPGRRAVAATAMPAMSPPPPTGTTMRSTSGRSSRISTATVPWPAIIASSSNGCRKRIPAASSSRTMGMSFVVSAPKRTSAP